MTEKRINVIGGVEVADFYIVNVGALSRSPDRAELAAQAAAVLKAELKDVLGGKAPVFGRDLILALVMEIMAEDYDADGAQTTPRSEYENGVPVEAAAPFRKLSGAPS